MRIIAVLLVFICSSMPIAGAEAVEVEPIWNSIVQKKITFQNSFFDLAARHWPDMKVPLRIHRDLQIALIHRRDHAFHYWLQHDPNRIFSEGGIAEFMNLRVGAQDHLMLKMNIQPYADLTKLVHRLRIANNSHAAWPDMHKRFEVLQFDADFQNLMREYDDFFKESHSLLKGEDAVAMDPESDANPNPQHDFPAETHIMDATEVEPLTIS